MAGRVGHIGTVAPVAMRRHRSHSARDIGALLARVDVDVYADALLAMVEREVPALATLSGDVRGHQVGAALRTLGTLSLQVLSEGPAGATPVAPFIDAIADTVEVWGLSVDDLTLVLSLSGSVFAEHLFRGLSGQQVLALVDRIGQGPGIPDLFGRIISAAKTVQGPSTANQERLAQARLAGTPPQQTVEVRPVAGGQRCFVARITDAPLREHAALAQLLRDDHLDAATGSDHVFGVLAAGEPVPCVDGAVVVAEDQPRDADIATRRRWLLELADTAEGIGVQGSLSGQDLIPHRLLLASPNRWRSLNERLDRVRTGGPAVLEAMAAFSRTGSVASAATDLGVHRETVRSRVKRAEKLAGLDLTTVRGRSILALSMIGSTLGDVVTDLGPAPPGGRASPMESGAAPAFARIDLDALTNRAVEILSRRALVAGPQGDATEVHPADVREGLLEAMWLLQAEAAYPWLELTAASKQRLARLTLGVPVDDAHAAVAEVLSALGHALIDVATRDERLAFPRVIGRQWALAAVVHEAIKLRWQAGGSRSDAFGELLDALETGSTPRHVLASRAHVAGLDTDERYRALVVVFAEKSTTASAFAMTLRAAGWAAVARGREVSALVAADATDAVLRTMLLDRCVACASDAAALPSFGDVLPPLRQLVAAADAAGRRGLLDADEEVIELMLLRCPDLAALLRQRVIGALASHDAARGVDLVATLLLYVESGLRRGPTADALHIHANSVDHRLRAIEERTGLSFTNTSDVLVLALAVTAQRLAMTSCPADLPATTSSSELRKIPAGQGAARRAPVHRPLSSCRSTPSDTAIRDPHDVHDRCTDDH